MYLAVGLFMMAISGSRYSVSLGSKFGLQNSLTGSNQFHPLIHRIGLELKTCLFLEKRCIWSWACHLGEYSPLQDRGRDLPTGGFRKPGCRGNHLHLVVQGSKSESLHQLAGECYPLIKLPPVKI